MTWTGETDQITEPVRIVASELIIVDRKGKPRIRMLVEDDGTAAVEFLDRDERLRMALYLKEPDVDDEDYVIETGSDNDSGLLVTGRLSGASIRLGISDDRFFGRRPRLEVAEGPGWGKRRHRFPSISPNVSD